MVTEPPWQKVSESHQLQAVSLGKPSQRFRIQFHQRIHHHRSPQSDKALARMSGRDGDDFHPPRQGRLDSDVGILDDHTRLRGHP